jgi:hypothetical protein
MLAGESLPLFIVLSFQAQWPILATHLGPETLAMLALAALNRRAP